MQEATSALAVIAATVLLGLALWAAEVAHHSAAPLPECDTFDCWE